MGLLPGVCVRCGYFMVAKVLSDLHMEHNTFTNCTLSGTFGGPNCPRCGGAMAIPDGVYSSFGDALEVVSAQPHTRAFLEGALAALRSAASARDPAAMRAAIESTLPELRSLRSVIPQTRSELYAFLALLIALLALKCSSGAGTQIKIEQVIQHIYNEGPKAFPNLPPASSPPGNQPMTSAASPGRNDPCPCGNGKKFKKCHGDPTIRA